MLLAGPERVVLGAADDWTIHDLDDVRRLAQAVWVTVECGILVSCIPEGRQHFRLLPHKLQAFYTLLASRLCCLIATCQKPLCLSVGY